MSSESTKRRIKRNREILLGMRKKIFFSGVAWLIFSLLMRKPLATPAAIITFMVEIGIYYFVAKLASSVVIKTPSGMEIKDRGIDLSARGAVYIFKDILNISVGVKLAALFLRSKALIGFLLIPVTAYYELCMRKEPRPHKG